MEDYIIAQKVWLAENYDASFNDILVESDGREYIVVMEEIGHPEEQGAFKRVKVYLPDELQTINN